MIENGLEDQLATVNNRGMPVAERIVSVEAARTVVAQLYDDEIEAKRRARIKGLIDGAAPYNQTRLVELGMGNRINVNFLEAKATLDRKAAAHYELFFEVPTLIEARLAPGFGDDVTNTQYGSILAEEFTKTVMSWSGFLVNMDIVRREADAYGLGVVLFRDEHDWRPKACRRSAFLVHPLAGLDVEELPMFGVRDSMPVHELYTAALKNEAVAKESGWNPAAVKRLLVRLYKKESGGGGDDAFQMSDWESLQQRIRNNDWSFQPVEMMDVQIVHLCVRELDTGGVSHYILPEKADPGRDEFLFKAVNRYPRMSQAIWWLPYNSGDSYVRGIRGLASMIEPHCDLSNRFLCQTFDAGFLAGSLVIQPNTPMDLSKLLLVRMGPLTVLPPGVTAIQRAFVPNLMQMVELRQLSSTVMQNNTGVFRQNPETFGERQPQKTARQVAEESAKEARIEKAHVAFDYSHIERLYREMFRRMTNPKYVFHSVDLPGRKEALDFIARCVIRGVPLNLLLAAPAWEINITRAIGMGSWGVRMDITNQLLSYRNLFDEEGQINVIRDWAAVRVGYQNVDRYKPLKNRNSIASNETSLAQLENNDLVEGSVVVVGSDQTHALHLQVHNQLAIELLQAWQQSRGQGMDLMRVQRTLAQLVKHLEETTAYLAADPARKDLVKQQQQIMKALIQMMQDIQREIEKASQQQMQAQQQQQELMAEAIQNRQAAEMQAKVAEIVGKLKLEEMKQESLNNMRMMKTQQQNAIREAGAAHDMRLKAERQAADIQLDAITAQAKIDIERAKQRAVQP